MLLACDQFLLCFLYIAAVCYLQYWGAATRGDKFIPSLSILFSESAPVSESVSLWNDSFFDFPRKEMNTNSWTFMIVEVVHNNS